MVLTDYFDKTYCINLDRRADKWDECLVEFNLHGLTVDRFSAVDGNVFNPTGGLKPGVIGCAMSHRRVIELAKGLKFKTVLILEDDVAFDPMLNYKFSEWYKEVPEGWDMLYLGGNHNTKVIERCSPHLLKATKTQTTHAYALRDTVYDMILDRLNNIDFDVDVIYMEIQKKTNAFCFTPRLAWQREGVSDIWNVHVNYDFIKDNDGCHR
jgi:GR25 family glycosyltransferase involved in LPS biosynthesis